MGKRLWVLGLVLFLVPLAGCVDGDGSDRDESMDPGDDGSGQDQDPGMQEEQELPLVEDPQEMTLYVTADGSLSAELPPAGSIEQGDWVPDYLQGQVDIDPFVFLSDPLPNATLLQTDPVQVTIWAQSDTPQPPFPGAQQTGAGTFFGGSLGMPLYLVELGDPVFPAGEQVRFDLTLGWNDYVPLVIPKGESIALFAALFAMTTDAAPGQILVGGDHATAVTFTMSNLTRDPTEGLGSFEQEAFTGLIENADSPRQEHTFELAEDTTELRVEIELTGGNHESDLDIDLFDATGTHISGSHTPSVYESIHLMGPALEGLQGTTLMVQVGHFTPVNAEYEITVSQR